MTSKNVIDWSMTILAETLVGCAVLLKIVTDQSMTILKPPLGRIRNRLSQKIVIDRSMTILKPPWVVLGIGYHRKLSVTGQ